MHFSLTFLSGMLVSAALYVMATPLGAPEEASAYAAQAVPKADASKEPVLGVDRSDNGMFYVQGEAGNQKVKFLLDTGASHVILSKADAQRLAPLLTAAKGGGLLQTAGGQTPVDWVIVRDLTISGQRLSEVKAAIPKQDVGTSLLGQNALAQFRSVHIDGDRLRLTL
jgi:aspartyl protease family protein